jgi:hypothetical protein
VIIYAWQEPTQPPPQGNVPAPINIGNNSQYKSGALGIGGIIYGESNAYFDGNVGIGTTNPDVKLTVNGSGKFINGGLRTDYDTYLAVSSGNVGIGTMAPHTPAPNGGSGNLDVNDVYLRSIGKWASQSSQSSQSIRVSDEYNCDRSRGQSGWCDIGTHKVCFLTAAHGYGDNGNDCRIKGTPDGNWSIYSWCDDDPWLHCRARCLDW